jgi:hypothetical protein
MLQRDATEEPSRQVDGAEVGERVTSAELDELTRAFADRYVGLLYSVCDGWRGRSAAAEVLAARGLFAEVGEAGQAVDEARLLGERMFYRLKRESTLLRWQSVAMKDDLVATPELSTALADVHRLTDQIERLPANIAAERQAILKGLDDRLQRADATIANVRATLHEATTFVASLKPAGESLNEMLTTADTLVARYAASDRPKTGNEGHPFDIREYEQTAKEVTRAAARMNDLLTATEHLLGSPELRDGMQEVNDSIDGRIMTVADQSQVVMNGFFWRVCASLGVLFAMLILYRVVSLLLMRNREKSEAAR